MFELEEFYSLLDFTPISEARFFPYITTFTNCGTGSKVQFKYERHADPIPGGSKAVFIANTSDDRRVFVKFTQEYNDTGHSLLAAKGLAPPLLCCDRSTFSDLVMVVMGYVDGRQLLHEYPLATPAEVLEKVSEALKILHANDLVFGDLRLPNILVTGQGDVQLVDFDWRGKVGEAEYPASINLVDIKWPMGMVPGGLLRLEHGCSRDCSGGVRVVFGRCSSNFVQSISSSKVVLAVACAYPDPSSFIARCSSPETSTTDSRVCYWAHSSPSD